MEAGDVVGENASLGVTNRGRNALSFTSNLGLLTKWLELTSDFASKVVEAGEVDLHRLELALGLLFASAVLEDSGGFFNKAAAFFRCCLQNVVELALTNDDVHLAAETGVAQKLLNI